MLPSLKNLRNSQCKFNFINTQNTGFINFLPKQNFILRYEDYKQTYKKE